MDLELLQLALKSLSGELTEMRTELLALRTEVRELKRNGVNTSSNDSSDKKAKNDDDLLTLHTARKILNVGRNTFLTLVKNGIIKPIRMNLRTIRYSRIELQRYIQEMR